MFLGGVLIVLLVCGIKSSPIRPKNDTLNTINRLDSLLAQLIHGVEQLGKEVDEAELEQLKIGSPISVNESTSSQVENINGHNVTVNTTIQNVELPDGEQAMIIEQMAVSEELLEDLEDNWDEPWDEDVDEELTDWWREQQSTEGEDIGEEDEGKNDAEETEDETPEDTRLIFHGENLFQ